MGALSSPRRGFLWGMAGAPFALLVGVRPAAADEKKHGSASSGIAATWKHRWHEGFRARDPGPRPGGVPEEFVPVGDHVKHKTHHWARPKDWPVGPTVESVNGEISSVEFRIAKADFERGFSWSLIYPKELRDLKVDHVDIEVMSAGHGPLRFPHYEIHLYFVPHGEHVACEL